MTDLDLEALAVRVDLPDAAATAAARELQRTPAAPDGVLGRLDELALWLCGVQGACPPRPFERPRLVVLAGDHGVALHGVSANPPGATAQEVAALREGRGTASVLARAAGVGVRVVDVSVEGSEVGRSGSIDREDAVSVETAARALAAGAALADEEVDAGADLLVVGDVGVGSTTAAATLVALLTGTEVADVVGRGSGIDDVAWMRKCAAVRDAARRGRPVLGDPVRLLATVGGADLAATTGFLLQAALRRTPVVLDGVVVAACALVGQRVAHRAPLWWLAGHRSTEPAHAVALDRLGLDPVLDLGLRVGEGCGGLLAVPLLAAAVEALRETASRDETERRGPA